MSGEQFAEEQERAHAQAFGHQADEMNIDTAGRSQLQTQSAAADHSRPSRKRTAGAAFVDPDEGSPAAKRRCGPCGVPAPVAATTTTPPAPRADDGDDGMDWEALGLRLGSPVSDGDQEMGEGEDDDDDDDSVAMSTFVLSEAPSPERYF